LTCKSRRRASERTMKTYSVLNVAVGTVRKSIAIVPARYKCRNAPHVTEGGRPTGRDGFGMYLATASLLTAMAEHRELECDPSPAPTSGCLSPCARSARPPRAPAAAVRAPSTCTPKSVRIRVGARPPPWWASRLRARPAIATTSATGRPKMRDPPGRAEASVSVGAAPRAAGAAPDSPPQGLSAG
jgi:hypothetical protein